MRIKIIFPFVCLFVASVAAHSQQLDRESTLHRVSALQDSLKHDANSISASVELARCYMALDSLRQAENVLYHVQTVHRDDPRVYIGLGELYEKQGIKDMARTQYQIALKRDPNSVAAKEHLDAVGESVKPAPKESDEPKEGDFVDVEEEPEPITPLEKSLVYPEDMRQARTEGSVELDALIDKDGRVLKVSILKSTDPSFTQAAKDAIMNTKFTPARAKGQPLKVWITRTIRFKLTNN